MKRGEVGVKTTVSILLGPVESGQGLRRCAIRAVRAAFAKAPVDPLESPDRTQISRKI
jgi:hypothetical protein